MAPCSPLDDPAWGPLSPSLGSGCDGGEGGTHCLSGEPELSMQWVPPECPALSPPPTGTSCTYTRTASTSAAARAPCATSPCGCSTWRARTPARPCRWVMNAPLCLPLRAWGGVGAGPGAHALNVRGFARAPTQVIFGKSSCSEFTREAFTAVVYHNKYGVAGRQVPAREGAAGPSARGGRRRGGGRSQRARGPQARGWQSAPEDRRVKLGLGQVSGMAANTPPPRGSHPCPI